MSQLLAVRPKSGRPTGRREANKLDKLRRIQTAAEELFVTRGYDSATMRDIAAQAGVALGTLFLYAGNKRDLLFLIANDIMEGAVDEAASLIDGRRSVTHNVTLIAGVHFRAFGGKPELFRLVLRELLFYNTGVQGLRAVKNRSRLLQLIQHMVAAAAASGQIRPKADAEMITRVVFAIIQAEIRSWIALESRVLRAGLKSVWGSVALLESGIAVQPTTPSIPDAKLRKLVSQITAGHAEAEAMEGPAT